jgi:hypothetical protein
MIALQLTYLQLIILAIIILSVYNAGKVLYKGTVTWVTRSEWYIKMELKRLERIRNRQKKLQHEKMYEQLSRLAQFIEWLDKTFANNKDRKGFWRDFATSKEQRKYWIDRIMKDYLPKPTEEKPKEEKKEEKNK